jgi:hypothetical protein
MSRRTLQRGSVLRLAGRPGQLREALRLVADNEVATGRFEAQLQAPARRADELPVHVIVSQTDRPDSCWWR